MINADYPLASWFLVVATTFFTGLFALPLLLCPLRWARWFGWQRPEGSVQLTVYFGRCLGGVALAVILALLRGIPDPKSHTALFDLISLVCGMMTGVHLWGAFERSQPWTEDVEILMYAAVAAGAAWIRFSTLA